MLVLTETNSRIAAIPDFLADFRFLPSEKALPEVLGIKGAPGTFLVAFYPSAALWQHYLGDQRREGEEGVVLAQPHLLCRSSGSQSWQGYKCLKQCLQIMESH